MNHPNLSPELNAICEKSETQEGIYLYDPGFGPTVAEKNVLPIGATVAVQTRNTRYLIVKTGEKTFTIEGNLRYCPSPVDAHIHGSNFGGSVLKLGFVGPGMYMEFSITPPGGTISTSVIQSVERLYDEPHASDCPFWVEENCTCTVGKNYRGE